MTVVAAGTLIPTTLILPCQARTLPADTLARALLHEVMNHDLDRLCEREQRVIVLRFGLDNSQARTAQHVGVNLD